MANDTDTARPTEPLTIRLPVSHMEELRERAKRNYRPLSREIEWALDEAWSREREAEAA